MPSQQRRVAGEESRQGEANGQGRSGKPGLPALERGQASKTKQQAGGQARLSQTRQGPVQSSPAGAVLICLSACLACLPACG